MGEKFSDSSLNLRQCHTRKVGGQKILTEMFDKVCVKIFFLYNTLSLLSFALVLMKISLLIKYLSSERK